MIVFVVVRNKLLRSWITDAVPHGDTVTDPRSKAFVVARFAAVTIDDAEFSKN